MSSSFFGRRLLAVGLALSCWFVSPQSAKADLMASVSGYVYLDYNGSRNLDSLDYAVRGALVTLTRSDDPGFSVSVSTDSKGYYFFDNLAATTTGSYTISQRQYTCHDGADNLGSIYGSTGAIIADTSRFGQSYTAANGVPKNSFTGIKLSAGDRGLNYNFGERDYPLELVTLRSTMDQGTPAKVSITAVPEPAAAMMLLAAVAGIAMARLRRRAQ